MDGLCSYSACYPAIVDNADGFVFVHDATDSTQKRDLLFFVNSFIPKQAKMPLAIIHTDMNPDGKEPGDVESMSRALSSALHVRCARANPASLQRAQDAMFKFAAGCARRAGK